MRSPARIAKHPVHPMLIVFPIGLWGFSLASDIIYLFTGTTHWVELAFYSMAGGVIGAVVAGIPGLIDMLAIAEAPIRRIALNHMVLNAIALAIYVVDLFLRAGAESPVPLTIALSFVGILVVGASGWLGGEMVYVHGVAVDPRAKNGNAQRHRGKLRRIG